MRVLVVEPYLGGSHRAWAEGYRAHSSLEVDVIGLPARHWKWRMHGGHVSLADQLTRVASGRGIDALLVSDMTNVPGLLGLVGRRLGDPAVVLYLHENQLTYPLSPDDRPDLTYALINWTSMLAADVVAFNSGFHRDDWFAALPGLLERLPDDSHLPRLDGVRERSTVLPVGVDVTGIRSVPGRRGDRPLVVWNHRWEYDQAPDEFGEAVLALAEADVAFDLALLGDRTDPPVGALAELRERVAGRIVADGLVDRTTYVRLLRAADVTVSTARHEFFGVALTEAMAAGAFPIVPDRVVYPERIPHEFHDRCLYRTPGELVDQLGAALAASRQAPLPSLAAAVERFDWPVVAGEYDTAIAAAVERRRHPTGTA